jgi:hypothetical protein
MASTFAAGSKALFAVSAAFSSAVGVLMILQPGSAIASNAITTALLTLAIHETPILWNRIRNEERG